jgi:hypothetical protein
VRMSAPACAVDWCPAATPARIFNPPAFLTPASLMAGSPNDLRIAHTGVGNYDSGATLAERLNSLGSSVV